MGLRAEGGDDRQRRDDASGGERDDRDDERASTDPASLPVGATALAIASPEVAVGDLGWLGNDLAHGRIILGSGGPSGPTDAIGRHDQPLGRREPWIAG